MEGICGEFRECIQRDVLSPDPDRLCTPERTGFHQEAPRATLPFSAVFSSIDFIALGAIQGVSETYLTLPEELSIVGFNDMQATSYMVPALITIRQSAHEMGRRAAEMLQLMETSA